MAIIQISPSALGDIPSLSQAVPGSNDFSLFSLPPPSGPRSLPIQTSPNCPAPSFFSSLRDSRGISQASFSHGFWGLEDTQGTVSFWQSPSLPSATELPVSRGQPALSQPEASPQRPPRLVHCVWPTFQWVAMIRDIPKRAEHTEMPPLPSFSTGLRFQESPKQLFREGQKELSRPRRTQCTVTQIPGRQIHPGWDVALGRTYSCSGPPAPAGC